MPDEFDKNKSSRRRHNEYTEIPNESPRRRSTRSTRSHDAGYSPKGVSRGSRDTSTPVTPTDRSAGTQRSEPSSGAGAANSGRTRRPNSTPQSKPQRSTPQTGAVKPGGSGAKPTGAKPDAGASKGKPSGDGISAAAGAAGRAAGAKQAKASEMPGKSSDASAVNPAGRQHKDATDPSTGDHHMKDDSPTADPAASPEDGLTGGLKGFGADATGVDYSDKGLRDRLEHQAADAAMDATPYLAQANSARKALKKYNKEKKDAGGKDDQLTDKVEDVADKAVDGGIKATKVAGFGLGSGGLGMMGMMGFMLVKTLAFFKGMGAMAMGLLASIGSAISSAFAAVTTFIASSLSIGSTLAASLLSTMIAGALIVSTVVGSALFSGPDDAGVANACVPTSTAVASGVIERIESDGQGSAQREESAKKLWSVYSALGGTKANTAAVLGNLHHESGGLDPTAVETVFSEPFTIGPEKKRAASVDFRIKAFNPSYAAQYPAIEHMGIGLTQWTNGRNLLLQNFAKEQDMPWYEFDTQMMFMLEGDEEYRQTQLANFIKKSETNVDAATNEFMTGWTGLPAGHSSLGTRQSHAKEYALMLERATADKDYADGILAGVNIDKSEGNNAAGAFHQDDGCGDTVKSHYANVSADGTGAVPTDLTLTPWKRNDLPESLKKYAVNPEDTGLAWGHSEGWAQYILPDQCVALSDSYMINLYPEWNKGGRSTQKPGGNGHVTATNWAAHFGEKTSPVPQKGAVFSSNVFPPYGHTGIVQHVFENGDILIVEQNIRGYSGEFAPGLNYSWSWQVIRKGTYESENWDFFKPSEFEPQWYKDGRKAETPAEDEAA